MKKIEWRGNLWCEWLGSAKGRFLLRESEEGSLFVVPPNKSVKFGDTYDTVANGTSGSVHLRAVPHERTYLVERVVKGDPHSFAYARLVLQKEAE